MVTNRSRSFSFNFKGVGSGASLLRSGADKVVLVGRPGAKGPFVIFSLASDLEEALHRCIYVGESFLGKPTLPGADEWLSGIVAFPNRLHRRFLLRHLYYWEDIA
jgi:hypothetical protein